MTLIDQYKEAAFGFTRTKAADAAVLWTALFDWWPDGRILFEQAYLKETGNTPSVASIDDLLGAAIPKSPRDLERKFANDAYYRAHARLFLQEMDHIVSRVPRANPDREAVFAFDNALRFARHTLADSVILFEHWAERSLKIPGVFGVGKNEVEHMHTFLMGARQTVYGHGTFGLSFMENHSDLAIGTIRQALEIRLRRAFGVYGRISDNDETFEPVPISAVFDAIQPFEAQITAAVPFPLLRRINGWANMYMHGAIKLPSWTAPRVLARLQPLLLGSGKKIGDGISMPRTAFEGVRQGLKDKYDSTKAPIALFLEPQCEVVIGS